MFRRSFSLMIVPLLAALSLIVGACSGGGSGGGSTTAPPPAPATGSVTVTGIVSGTIIKVVRADTGLLISQADTAPLPGPPPFPFTLSNIPVGVPVKVFFFSAGQTFLLYGGSPPTNVFTAQTAGSIDLGLVTMSGGIATSPNQVTNVTFGPEDPSIPAGIEPPPAKLTVTTPAPATGSVIVNFVVQNFSVGGQGQPHLHISVDGGPTRHFFNGQTNNVLDADNGLPTTDVQRQSSNSFRLNGLVPGDHSVTVRLSTASGDEFVNLDAKPADVPITINNPPVPPETLTITDPLQGALLPSGPVLVAFAVQDFMIGGQGTPHLHIYLDGSGTANHFFNAPTNQVLNGNGQPIANITWQSNTSFQITGLASGPHTIRLVLASDTDQDLQNPEANPPILNITIQPPPGTSTVTVTSGTSFPSSPVGITFSVTNFTIGLPGTPHLRFSIDSGPLHDFYDGAGINSDNGVLLNGVHDHAVHWTSPNSFDLFALPASSHSVRLALVDQNNQELPGALTTHNFTVQQPPTGELQLQSVLSSLDFPVGLSLAPDGRIFYNERLTGKIRIIQPGWLLDPTECVQLSVEPTGERGLLGLALDPDFAQNGFVYVYYSEANTDRNRVVRFKEVNGLCTQQTTILDTLPQGTVHNGGIIQFGPDKKLYVVIGDTFNEANAQNLTSLAGKILRVDPVENGPGLPGNPFFGSGNVNQDRVFSYGHRNSYGFTFHPQTNDLWESENGPDDNDEINRVVAGGNYGWDSNRRGGVLNDPCCIDPILTFNPVIAPTGIIAIPGNSSVYPTFYRNNLLVAVWIGGTIRHVVLSGTNLDHLGGSSVAYNGGQGGLLSLMLGSDGYVYVSNSSAIFRVVPH